MASAKMNAEEARWRAESDARTMAEYEAIMADSKRKGAAVRAAKSLAKDLNTRATAMTRVTQTGSRKK